MNRYLLATVSSLTVVGTASAADVAPITALPQADFEARWTGPYIGLNGGIAWHKATIEGVFPPPPGDMTITGATLGAQAGYNWQWDRFVAGVEADINWVDGSDTTGCCFGLTFSSDLSWLATLRGRAGLTVTPQTLLYVTGGLAIGRVENRVSTLFVDEQTRTGWTVGGGVEHMFSPRWSAKVEALYVDLGSETVLSGAYTGRFENTAVIGRLGLNLKW